MYNSQRLVSSATRALSTMPRIAAVEGEELLKRDSRQAIATQIQQRLNYDLRRLLPSLHGLANLLTDASTQSITPELEELSDLLSSMRVSVDHIMTQSATGANPEAPIPSQPSDLPQAAALSRGQHRPGKRSHHPFLLPPSPERRQKRKESYAPL